MDRKEEIEIFREWLDDPDKSPIVGVESFWGKKTRLLLAEIDSLRDELKKEKESNLKNAKSHDVEKYYKEE